MKEKIVIALSCIFFLMCQLAFAHSRVYKGDVYTPPTSTPIKKISMAWNSWSPEWSCNQDSCTASTASSCNQDSCTALEGCGWSCGLSDGACGACNCTDPGCGRNPCISARKCCQVFGNIGDGDLGDIPDDCHLI